MEIKIGLDFLENLFKNESNKAVGEILSKFEIFDEENCKDEERLENKVPEIKVIKKEVKNYTHQLFRSVVNLIKAYGRVELYNKNTDSK